MVAAMAEKYGEWHAMAYCEEEAMAVGADKWHMACFIVTREEGATDWWSGLAHGLSMEHGDDRHMEGTRGRQGVWER
jgi:hypothetical protein